MQTVHSFQALKALNYVKEGSFTPYTDEEKKQRALQLEPPIAVYVNNDDEPMHIVKTIIRRYKNTVEWNKKRVNNTLRPLYGQDLEFANNVTSEMVEKVRNVMEMTGKTIKQIAKDLRAYLGYPCTFFRKRGNVQIPVNSDRIVRAYKAMEAKKYIYEIEIILFE